MIKFILLRYFCVQVLSVKFRGILLQLANGVQGFTPHQLAKGIFTRNFVAEYYHVPRIHSERLCS